MKPELGIIITIPGRKGFFRFTEVSEFRCVLRLCTKSGLMFWRSYSYERAMIEKTPGIELIGYRKEDENVKQSNTRSLTTAIHACRKRIHKQQVRLEQLENELHQIVSAEIAKLIP